MQFDYKKIEATDRQTGVELGLYNREQAQGALGKFRLSVDLALQEVVNRSYHAFKTLATYSNDERYAKVFEHFYGDYERAQTSPLDLNQTPLPADVNLFANASENDKRLLEQAAEKLITTKNIGEIGFTFQDGTPNPQTNKYGEFGLTVVDWRKRRTQGLEYGRVATEGVSLNKNVEATGKDLGVINHATIFQFGIDNQTNHEIKCKTGGLDPNKIKYAPRNVQQWVSNEIQIGENNPQSICLSRQYLYTGGKRVLQDTGIIQNIYPVAVAEENSPNGVRLVNYYQQGNIAIYPIANYDNDENGYYNFPNHESAMPSLNNRIINGEIQYGTSHKNELSSENMARFTNFKKIVDKAMEITLKGDRLWDAISSNPWVSKKNGEQLAKNGLTAQAQTQVLTKHLMESANTPTIMLAPSDFRSLENDENLTSSPLDFMSSEVNGRLVKTMLITTKALDQYSDTGLNDDVVSGQIYLGDRKKSVSKATPTNTVHQTLSKLENDVKYRKGKVLTVVLTEGISTASALGNAIEQSNMFDDFVVLSTMDAGNLKRIAKDFSQFETDKETKQTPYMGYDDVQFIVAGDNDYKVHPEVYNPNNGLSPYQRTELERHAQKGQGYHTTIEGQPTSFAPVMNKGGIASNTGYLFASEAVQILNQAGKTAIHIQPSKEILRTGSVLDGRVQEQVQQMGFEPKENNPYTFANTDYDDMANNIHHNLIAQTRQSLEAQGLDSSRLSPDLDKTIYQLSVAQTGLTVYNSIVASSERTNTPLVINKKEQCFNLIDEPENNVLNITEPLKEPQALSQHKLPYALEQSKIDLDSLNVPKIFEDKATSKKIDLGTPNENVMLYLANFSKLPDKIQNNATAQKLHELYQKQQLPEFGKDLGRSEKTDLLNQKRLIGEHTLNKIISITDPNMLNTIYGEFKDTWKKRGIKERLSAEMLTGDAKTKPNVVFLDVRKGDKYASDASSTKDATEFMNGQKIAGKDKMTVIAYTDVHGAGRGIELKDSDLASLANSGLTIFTQNSTVTSQILHNKGVNTRQIDMIDLQSHFMDSADKDYIDWYENAKQSKNSMAQEVIAEFSKEKNVLTPLVENSHLNSYIKMAVTNNQHNKVKVVDNIKEIHKENGEIKNALAKQIHEILNDEQLGVMPTGGIDTRLENLWDNYSFHATPENGLTNGVMDEAVKEYKRTVLDIESPNTEREIKEQNGKKINLIDKMGTIKKQDSRLQKALFVEHARMTALQESGQLTTQAQQQQLKYLDAMVKIIPLRAEHNKAQERENQALNAIKQQSQNGYVNFTDNAIGTGTGRQTQMGFSQAMGAENLDLVKPSHKQGYFVTVDLSSADAVSAMLITGDKEMMETYRQGGDIYALAGAKLEGGTDAEKRQLGKLYTLSSSYGQSMMGLAEKENVSYATLKALDGQNTQRIQKQGGEPLTDIRKRLQDLLSGRGDLDEHNNPTNKVILHNRIYPDRPAVLTFERIVTDPKNPNEFAIQVTYGIDGSKSLFPHITADKKDNFTSKAKDVTGKPKKEEDTVHGGRLLAWGIQGTTARAVREHRVCIHNELAKTENKELAKDAGEVKSLHDDVTCVATADKVKAITNIMQEQMAIAKNLSNEPLFNTKVTVSKALTKDHNIANELETNPQFQADLQAIQRQKEQAQALSDSLIKEMARPEMVQEQAQTPQQNPSPSPRP